MAKANRKIVITSAIQAIATILERRSVTVALTGDVAIYLHGGQRVPQVSTAYRAHPSASYIYFLH